MGWRGGIGREANGFTGLEDAVMEEAPAAEEAAQESKPAPAPAPATGGGGGGKKKKKGKK